ncbi:MAG: hypothetical protein JXP37_08560 [Coriobacteriia bacterium]|nr:hypothetical protein [Coriobacteriia bacterium]
MLKINEDLDLTFPAKERAEARAAYTRAARIHVNDRPPAVGVMLILTFMTLSILFGCYSVGRATSRNKYEPIAAEALSEASYAVDTAEQARDTAAYWKDQATEASATIEALRSELASATSELSSLSVQIHDLQELNTALKRQIDPEVKEQSYNAPEGAWTREQVASTLTAAAKGHELTAEETAWVVETGVRVAYRESTFRPDARNGQYLGLFQFGDAWGSSTQRLDPVWSCYRFVKVYADGGEAKIIQHWASTVGV